MYEPVAIEPPDLELLITAHLRGLNSRSEVLFGREYPATLPVTIASVTYTKAVIIRDDGGPWPNRTISAGVLGQRDDDCSDIRDLAVEITSRLSLLAESSLPIASVVTVRGPMSVADNPPEFQSTADLLVVG